MVKLAVGEVAPLPGERFPRICISIDGKRYLLTGSDASRFGAILADAARSTVSRVDIDRLRQVILEIEVTAL